MADCTVARLLLFSFLASLCLMPKAAANPRPFPQRSSSVSGEQSREIPRHGLNNDQEFRKREDILEQTFSGEGENPPVPPAVSRDGKLLDAKLLKSLLKDLLKRLESSTLNNATTFNGGNGMGFTTSHDGGGSGEGPRHINSFKARHCFIRGLWLSTTAGAVIELIPEQHYGHVEIHTNIFELPDYPREPLITSKWKGKGIISPESPTTMTIVFQEHIDEEEENNAKERMPRAANKESSVDIQLPRTAVFVGQCLVCHGNPMLKGTWVVFPTTQTCTARGGSGMPPNNRKKRREDPMQMNGHNTQDSIYLLHYN